MKENPSYYAIIPADVRYDENLKAMEKLMYGEITALANKKGMCWASNGFFADLYKCDKGTISRYISALEKNGYIKTIVKRDENNKIEQRLIYINQKSTPIDQIINTPIGEIAYPPIDQIGKENITRINNTSVRESEDENTYPIDNSLANPKQELANQSLNASMSEKNIAPVAENAPISSDNYVNLDKCTPEQKKPRTEQLCARGTYATAKVTPEYWLSAVKAGYERKTCQFLSNKFDSRILEMLPKYKKNYHDEMPEEIVERAIKETQEYCDDKGYRFLTMRYIEQLEELTMFYVMPNGMRLSKPPLTWWEKEDARSEWNRLEAERQEEYKEELADTSKGIGFFMKLMSDAEKTGKSFSECYENAIKEARCEA